MEDVKPLVNVAYVDGHIAVLKRRFIIGITGNFSTISIDLYILNI